MGAKGLVWSAASMGILLDEGIGDTVRVSLTPRPGGDRRDEVYAACELLQSLGLRTFAPSVTACPGCGRTTSSTFQELAESIQDYIRDKMPEWKRNFEGVEELKLAVMGTYEELSAAFQALVNDYVATKYARRETPLPAVAAPAVVAAAKPSLRVIA